MSPRKLTILVDVDDVCLDMVPEWLRRYNNDYGDTLTADALLTWDVSSSTKAGKAFYRYLHMGDFYDYVHPRDGARPAIDTLRQMGHHVYFVSSCVSFDAAQQKLNCLCRWGFLTDRNDFIATSLKHLVRGDVLIDDNAANIMDYPGVGLLIDRPWNRHTNVGTARLSGMGDVPEWITKHMGYSHAG